MIANYLKPVQNARVSRNALGRYLQRAAIDECLEKKLQKHEEGRKEELSAIVGAVDANWLYTLHNMKGLRLGKKRLRKAWEEMVRNRIALREFYRDGHGGYEEQPTGQNVEDEVTIKELLKIGVDIRAWEAEPIIIDHESGEVSFGTQEGGQ